MDEPRRISEDKEDVEWIAMTTEPLWLFEVIDGDGNLVIESDPMYLLEKDARDAATEIANEWSKETGKEIDSILVREGGEDFINDEWT